MTCKKIKTNVTCNFVNLFLQENHNTENICLRTASQKWNKASAITIEQTGEQNKTISMRCFEASKLYFPSRYKFWSCLHSSLKPGLIKSPSHGWIKTIDALEVKMGFSLVACIHVMQVVSSSRAVCVIETDFAWLPRDWSMWVVSDRTVEKTSSPSDSGCTRIGILKFIVVACC